MDSIKDNIYDAYYSKKGEEFGKKVRERIHWITQNVKGKTILDVGCSQGITPILLGREGKEVLGIDSSTSAIEDARENLLLEESETQKCVTFEQSNFFLKEFNKQYDNVILGEVLEHITDVKTFFDKAVSLTNDKGRIIVTTPFGINDFIDHKRTFYLLDFLKLQDSSVTIEEIKHFGKWIGVIFKKHVTDNDPIQINDSLLLKLEKALYSVEENYLRQNNELEKKLKVYKKKNIEYEELGNDQQNESQKQSSKEQYYLNEKAQKVKIQKELIETYSENEALINRHKKLLHDYELLLNRYQNLKNSKLGRIATKYWKFRNKKRGK